jgi:hypothetical protein
MLPSGEDSRKVIGMHRIVGGPVLQFLATSSEVVQDSPVDHLGLARGKIHERDKPGNTVDDTAEPLFACAERFLCPLAVVDVGQQVVPPDDAAILVTKWKCATLKPAVHPLAVPDSRIRVVGIPGLDGVRPSCCDLGQVLGVHGARPILQFLLGSTGIPECRFIDAFKRSVRETRGEEPWEAVDVAPLIVDIRVGGAPSHDDAGAIVEGVSSEEEPPVLAVDPP